MALEPFHLMETTPGAFSLLLRDLDATASTFESAGHAGNGYSWQAVAQYVLETELAHLSEQIEFDPEADMSCAYGSDRAALEALGNRLAVVARKPRRLAKLIASIPASA